MKKWKEYDKKNHYYTELTFKDIAEHLAFVQVIWNGKVVFDDYSYIRNDFTYNKDGETPESLEAFIKKYNNKLVYTYLIKVVDFHHCILDITGEK